MIRNVKVINYLGETLFMELTNPEKSGFLIMSITGLDSEKADIRTTDITTADGSIYNSSRLSSRNIVFTLKLFTHDGKTIEDIRQESYKYFPVKKPLLLLVEMNNRIGEILGYVESNEIEIFTKSQQATISIICPYPYFYDGGPNGRNTTIFSGVDPVFEFPFSNESLVSNAIIFGEIMNRNEEVVVYTGDAEVGITIIIDSIGDVRNLTIHNINTRETMKINTDRLSEMTGSTIRAGDRITISTIQGDKFITLLRSGIHTNILNTLERGSSWFRLSKGDNIFAFEADYGASNLMFRIENRILYEGL